MRIEFERSGGFMGLRQAISLDTSSMEPEEATELFKLVEKSKFFDLPNEMLSTSEGADHFQYRLTIEYSETTHTVTLLDIDTPDDLQPLLQRLNLMVRTRR